MTAAEFQGFPSRPQSAAIPQVFFTDVIPRLTDGVALAVAVSAFHLLAKKKGFPRYLVREDFTADPGLSTFIENSPITDSEWAIGAALEQLVAIEMVLSLAIGADGDEHDIYFLNAPADRRGMETVRAGAITPARVTRRPAVAASSSAYALYESLIGPVSPLIADELADAERLYPAEWLDGAFREAAAQNARSWRYVSRILERWTIEGPDDEKTERNDAGDSRYFEGKYGRVLKQRLGG